MLWPSANETSSLGNRSRESKVPTGPYEKKSDDKYIDNFTLSAGPAYSTYSPLYRMDALIVKRVKEKRGIATKWTSVRAPPHRGETIFKVLAKKRATWQDCSDVIR
jgi:hypothetical protein